MLLPTSARSRRNRWIYTLVILIVAVFGVIATIYAGLSAHLANRDNLIARVSTIAEAIDPLDVLSLAGDESDLGNSTYEGLKSSLMSMRLVNPDTRFIYINGIRDGTLFFYVDSEPEESEDYSPPGQLYEEASPLMHEIFEDTHNGFEVARDRWGVWASALVQLKDARGNVIALVGMDVPGNKYVSDVVAYGLLPFLLSLIIIGFVITLRHLMLREQRYLDQKGEFISVASHEIRAPLTAIRWAAETILSRRPTLLDTHTRETASLILESSSSLIGRVNNLLDMSALDTLGKRALHPAAIPLQSLLSDIVQTLKLVAAAHSIRLIVKGAEGENTVIYGDYEQIRHILVNLVSNGLKYGKANTEITISHALRDGFDEIAVADQGQGISSEDVEKIFQGYFRAEEIRKSKEGTGLGLYVARKIARAHGGDIVVRSEKGKGSIFTLRLPHVS